jgi:hypothetical protein
MNIFDKPYYPLSYFNYEVFVHCPKCHGLGVVTGDKEAKYFERDKSAKFRCFHCGYLAGNPTEWLGFYVGYIGLHYKGRACGNCGSLIQKEFPITKTPYKEGPARCATCGQVRNYEINWYRYHGHLPTDPYFGLELYFQKMVKKGNLWVYNLEHVEYLRDYLNSTVRDRESTALYTMVARLPAFIKSKKNKEAVTKQLDEFEIQIRKTCANINYCGQQAASAQS